MHTVFIRDSRLILTSSISNTDKKQVLFPLNHIDLNKIITKLIKEKNKVVYVYHPKQSQLLEHFKKRIKVVKAAGGVVENTKGEILFIHRNKKWDIPKGKHEKGETIENTALREVREETGIRDIILGNYLTNTYHVFYRNNSYQLKETRWYHMISNEITNKHLIPQIEEGITEVRWQPKSQLKILLNESYPNIGIVIEAYLSSLRSVATR